jgi:hypothetical protein
MITLSQYYTALEHHDWYYRYNHPGCGRNPEWYTLELISNDSPEHKKLFEDYSEWVLNKSLVKPVCPE